MAGSINLQTETIPPKYAFLQNLDVGLDVILIITWVSAALFYAFTIGRKKGPILLLSTYAGLGVASVIAGLNFGPSPGISQLQKGEYFQFIIFFVVFLVAFVSLIRIISRHIRIHSSKNGLIILAALEMGAFLATMGSMLPIALQRQVTGFAGLLFTTPWTHALWLVLPLIIILIGEHRDAAYLDSN